jgi:hypothetical protein
MRKMIDGTTVGEFVDDEDRYLTIVVPDSLVDLVRRFLDNTDLPYTHAPSRTIKIPTMDRDALWHDMLPGLPEGVRRAN